jgi:hypothetical protein
MPLNISIDVDGTLLDENEKPVRQARESLQMLKDAGHCLQLWSAGGADYAYNQAVKHKLTDLFESYAKKSDVAIDDLSETAHPLAVIHVNQERTLDFATKQVVSIEQNIDAALTPSSDLVKFVGQLQTEENIFRLDYGPILRPGIPLHPVPFFGVIEKARVITVGLNPSSTEFEDAGRWSRSPLSPHELTRRLVDYFRQPHAPPHHWFAELQWSLEILQCPYNFAAAHVDISPWTTYSPTYLQNNLPAVSNLYNQMIDAGNENWLPRTLEFCKDTVKLVIICTGNLQVEQRIRDTFDPGWNGEIVVMPRGKVPRWASENRERLIRLLDLEHIFP